MNCPYCASNLIRKNGHRRGKQNYICTSCDRQFLESYSKRGYNDEIKQQCLNMYVNGIGFRAIERLTGVNHNTVIVWALWGRVLMLISKLVQHGVNKQTIPNQQNAYAVFLTEF